jgi:hypothetical protein
MVGTKAHNGTSFANTSGCAVAVDLKDNATFTNSPDSMEVR